MPIKTWAVGEEVLAPDFNNYVQTQVVARFASNAARDAAWPAPTAGIGAVCSTVDTKTLWLSDGTAWQPIGGPLMFTKRAGDTMTGALTFTGASAQIRLHNDGAYLGFFDATGVTSRGYLSNGAANIFLQSAAGLVLNPTPPGQITVPAGGMDIARRGTSLATYDKMVIILRDDSAAGTSRSVGITFLNPGAYGPFFRAVEQSGERIEAINTGGAGCAAIMASAFTVFSTERFKDNIESVSVLDRVVTLRATKYDRTNPLQSARIVGHDDELDRDVLEVHDHDCAVDVCVGTDLVNDPCAVARRAAMAEYGLIAEEVLQVFPEAVPVDDDGLAEGVDLNQMLAIAIGAIGELTARVAALETAA